MDIYLYLREFPVDPDAPLSGPMKAVHGLASGLAASGASVVVLCEGASSAERCRGGYLIRRFRNDLIDARFYLAPELKAFLLRDFRRGIVILNGLFNPTLYSLGAWLRRHDIPYVAAPHSSYHPALFERNPHLKWPYWFLFERPFLRWSRAIQVLDSRQGEWISSLGIRKPTFQVPNGFDGEEVLPEEQLTWPARRVSKLIYFGRMDAHTKGLDLLIDAFGALRRRFDISLTIQGPNPGDRDKLRARAARLGVGDSVSFVDSNFRQSPTTILGGFDIVCLPSRYEGFGLSALEAMIAGRVLLVSSTAGIAPHVADSGCGVVIDPEDRTNRGWSRTAPEYESLLARDGIERPPLCAILPALELNRSGCIRALRQNPSRLLGRSFGTPNRGKGSRGSPRHTSLVPGE